MKKFQSKKQWHNKKGSYEGLGVLSRADSVLFFGRKDKVVLCFVPDDPERGMLIPRILFHKFQGNVQKATVRVKPSVCRGLSGSLLHHDVQERGLINGDNEDFDTDENVSKDKWWHMMNDVIMLKLSRIARGVSSRSVEW